MPETEARERVLNIAEKLFNEKGFKGVTLKEIATALGMKQASLYFHFPSKEALFIAVMERTFGKHRTGVESAIAGAGAALSAKLQAVADWLLSQPVLDFGRMMSSDMPAIDPQIAEQLSQVLYQSTMAPIVEVFRQAHQAGEIWHNRPILLAGAMLSVIETVHNLPDEWASDPRWEGNKAEMVKDLISVFMNGLRPR